MKKYATVDDYLDDCPDAHVAALLVLRKQIKKLVPDATESISYGMPMFCWNGHLVGYASFKKHCSFFPCRGTFPEDLLEEMKPYLKGKSTLQFTPENPLPASLIEKIVRFAQQHNQEIIAARLAKKKSK